MPPTSVHLPTVLVGQVDLGPMEAAAPLNSNEALHVWMASVHKREEEDRQERLARKRAFRKEAVAHRRGDRNGSLVCGCASEETNHGVSAVLDLLTGPMLPLWEYLRETVRPGCYVLCPYCRASPEDHWLLGGCYLCSGWGYLTADHAEAQARYQHALQDGSTGHDDRVDALSGAAARFARLGTATGRLTSSQPALPPRTRVARTVATPPGSPPCRSVLDSGVKPILLDDLTPGVSGPGAAAIVRPWYGTNLDRLLDPADRGDKDDEG
jgi:hypothetical protein